MSRNKTILIVVLVIIASLGWANYAIVNEECSRLKSILEELKSAYELLNARYSKLNEEYIKLKSEYGELQDQLKGRGREASEVRPSLSNITWKCVLEKRMQRFTNYVAISPNGEYVIISGGSKITALSKSGSILWDIDALEYLLTYEAVPLLVSDEGEAWIISINGWRLVAVKSGEVLLKADFSEVVRCYRMNDIEVSRDGKYIVAGPFGGPVYFYYRNNTKLIKLWEWTPIGDVEDVALSDNGTYVVIGNANGWVTLLKSDGALLWEKEIPYSNLKFIPNSSLICVIRGSEVGILNLNGEWVVKPFLVNVTISTWKYGHGISLSKDFIFIPEDLVRSNKIYVYDLKGKLISTLEVKGGVRDLAITPNGQRVVVCDDVFRIYLFEKARMNSVRINQSLNPHLAITGNSCV